MATRDDVLRALAQADGAWVSGQSLGESLAVSRAWISKHVKALEADGYGIERMTRRGYRLLSVPDRLTALAIGEGLATTLLGRGRVVCSATTGSTNDDAKRAASEGAEHGALFVAETQTAGRGRRGREWLSPSGAGIYASVVLRPTLALSDAPLTTIAAALATSECVRAETDLPVQIKWPNDVLVRGRKVAGLLTEMSAEMAGVEYVVVGVGINVNSESSDLPSDRLMYPASSIKQETGHRVERARVLANWLNALERWMDELVTHGGGALVKEWEARCGTIGKDVRVSGSKGIVEGRVLGLREDGALRLRVGGETICMMTGDVMV